MVLTWFLANSASFQIFDFKARSTYFLASSCSLAPISCSQMSLAIASSFSWISSSAFLAVMAALVGRPPGGFFSCRPDPCR